MKFLVFGSILRSTSFNKNIAANPASTKWLKGFLKGIESHGHSVVLRGPFYSRSWPHGPIYPGKDSDLDHAFDNGLVRYINFPGLRSRSMSNAYLKEGRRVLNAGMFDGIITYNPYPWMVASASRLREEFDVPWICLNLDFDDVGNNWELFIRSAGAADAHVFLSHWAVENAPVAKKLHIDGAVSNISPMFGPKKDDSSTVTIVYVGKLSTAGGIGTLLQLPGFLADERARFVYGGKGAPSDVQAIEALARRDSRVRFLGFVDDDEMETIHQAGDIFLNPRDPEIRENDMVFPSKIFEYLKTGRTVVSMRNIGLSPEYEELMVFSNGPDTPQFCEAVKRAFDEGHDARVARAERIRLFLTESRNWNQQAKRFLDFSERLGGSEKERH